MNKKNIFSTLVLIVTLLLRESFEQSCDSKYDSSMSGKCIEIDLCTGAALASHNCTISTQTCCIDDINQQPNVQESELITRNAFLSIVGDTVRNRAFYNFFVQSMNDAGIISKYQAAAFLSQIIGETKYFKSIESLNLEDDFNAKLGNNKTGDGIIYRGRGSILLRGRFNYGFADSHITGIIHLLSFCNLIY